MTTSEATPARTPRRVVVGVDGSAASLNALQWAVDYASALVFRKGQCSASTEATS